VLYVGDSHSLEVALSAVVKPVVFLLFLCTTFVMSSNPAPARANSSPLQSGTSSPVEVPPAVVQPNIDGRYTPLQDLKLTSLGQQLAEQDKAWLPTDEWSNDSVQIKYSLFYKPLKEPYTPEWYISLKQDGKWLYVLVDAVSETRMGEKSARTGYKDRRQGVTFAFDTENTPWNQLTFSTQTLYSMTFRFLSPDVTSLQCCAMPYVSSKWPALPAGHYQFKASLTDSPHSSVPHIVIEIAFDLDLLTRFYSTFGFRSYASDYSIELLAVDGEFNFRGEHSIPELRHAAFVSFSDANASIQRAWTEGRTENLYLARFYLNESQTAYGLNDYERTVNLAIQAGEQAEAATHPQEYYVAKDALANVTSLKLVIQSSNYTSRGVQDVVNQGLIAYDSAEKAFVNNEFLQAIDYAHNATALLQRAISMQQEERALAQQEARNREILTYTIVGVSIVTIAGIMVKRKRPKDSS